MKKTISTIAVVLTILVIVGMVMVSTFSQKIEDDFILEEEAIEEFAEDKIIEEDLVKKEFADRRTYKNEGYGIELKYPYDWEIKEEIGVEDGLKVIKDLSISLSPPGENDDFIFFGVGDMAILYPMSLNDYIDWYSRVVLHGEVILESEDITISSLPARKITFIPKEEPDFKVMIILAVKDEIFTYAFMYGAKIQKYSEFIDEADEIINSLEIISSPEVIR